MELNIEKTNQRSNKTAAPIKTKYNTPNKIPSLAIVFFLTFLIEIIPKTIPNMAAKPPKISISPKNGIDKSVDSSSMVKLLIPNIPDILESF